MKLNYKCDQVTKKWDPSQNSGAGSFIYVADFTFQSMQVDPGTWMNPPTDRFQMSTVSPDAFVPNQNYIFDIQVTPAP